MNQRRIGYLIGVVILILLLVLGFFYYKNKINNITISGQKNVSDKTDTPLVVENKKDERALTKTDETTKQETLKKAKWNTAIQNARVAFGRKEYPKAIDFYDEALSYYKTDIGYYGLFVVYGAQNDIENAKIAINKAIELNPSFTEQWNAKLTFLDEKTETSFVDLQKIYENGLFKVDSRTKIDLVTHFATIAESNHQKEEAVSLWKYAQELYPQNNAIYQGEIDRLQKN